MSYTGKFSTGDSVFLSNGDMGEVTDVNTSKESNNYAVKFPHIRPVWCSENELAGLRIKVTLPPIADCYDSDSGLGIGGINNDQSMPFIPSAAAIGRVQRLHDTDTICRRCGASKNFGGAMFTNFSGSNICDDCA